MDKSYLNEKHKVSDIADFADPKNKRFYIGNQKDADQLFGKIRRITGRDEIRKNAIKIIVRKRLGLPDNLLVTWPDPIDNSATQNKFSSNGDEYMSHNIEFKYIPKAERDALPNSDFGYVNGERRLFPVRNQDDLNAASHLIGRAKGLSDKDRENVKKKLKAIAKRKGLSIPKAWDNNTTMSGDKLVTIS